MHRIVLMALIALASLNAPVAAAQPAAEAPEARIRTFRATQSFKIAEARLAAEYEQTVADTIALTQIPAPPFKEMKRAEAYKAMFDALGLNAEIDAEGNVTALRKGTGKGPLVVVGAHMDTVFPEGVNTTVRREGNKLAAPGISDNTVSMAILLAIVRAMDAGKIETKGDILFVGNVGEEEKGGFRGVRYLFSQSAYADRIAYFVGLEPGKSGDVTTTGVGTYRYEVSFEGPGGHSMLDFGIVNPAYATADLIQRFVGYKGPLSQNTVYNVGLINGGTSINTIPAKITLGVDMRATDAAELEALNAYFLTLPALVTAAENNARSTKKGALTSAVTPVLTRPVVGISPDAPIVAVAQAAMRVSGLTSETRRGSSDSNVPQGLNRPGITIDSGFAYFGPHSPAEYILLEKDENVRGMANVLTTLVILANTQP